jgi:hypothetical protein
MSLSASVAENALVVIAVPSDLGNRFLSPLRLCGEETILFFPFLYHLLLLFLPP